MSNETLTAGNAIETPAGDEGKNKRGKKPPKKVKGVYEKVPGSGVWWIRYADKGGKIRREKAGTRESAISFSENAIPKFSKGGNSPNCTNFR